MKASVIFLFVFLCTCSIYKQKGVVTTTPNNRIMASTYNSLLSVTYVNNFDGDTITVNLPNSIPDVFGHEIPVRIRHIDTPEIKGNGKCEKEAAQKAKVATTSLLKNAKKIDLEDVGRDKYFRLLATVRADGVSIGQYLLDQKLAVPYEGDTKQVVDWCTRQRKIK